LSFAGKVFIEAPTFHFLVEVVAMEELSAADHLVAFC